MANSAVIRWKTRKKHGKDKEGLLSCISKQEELLYGKRRGSILYLTHNPKSMSLMLPFTVNMMLEVFRSRCANYYGGRVRG